MAKKRKNKRRRIKKERKPARFSLPAETKQWIWGVFLILTAILISLSFFEKAGIAGHAFKKSAQFLIGGTFFLIPLILVLGGLAFLSSKYNFNISQGERRIFWPIILAISILILEINHQSL